MRIRSALVLFLTAGFGVAHEDPRGEIHPQVIANQDGSFTVTFSYYDTQRGRQSGKRMMLGADGKEIVPRHWFDRHAPGTDPYELPDKFPGIRKVKAEKDGGMERFLSQPDPGGSPAQSVTRTLPVERPRSVGDYGGDFETAAVTGKEAILVYAEMEKREETMAIKLLPCRTDGFQPARMVALGDAACIYQFPCLSSPIWHAGRWWIAWVKAEKKEAALAWTTVLSSLDPASGKLEHHPLPGLSHWNTTLSIALNANGTFCVAWHTSPDEPSQGSAKVYTAVFTPPK